MKVQMDRPLRKFLTRTLLVRSKVTAERREGGGGYNFDELNLGLNHQTFDITKCLGKI